MAVQMHEPDRWRTVKAALAEFQECLSVSVPALRIVAANDRQWSKQECQRQRRTGVFAEKGVYLIYGAGGELLYVGVALVSFDKRIWMHDDYIPERRWTDVVPFQKRYVFLALALERFLIARLKPPRNTMGVA